MPGAGERKIVSRFRLLPAGRAGELPSNEAWTSNAVQVEQSDERPELPDATFKPSMLAGEQAVHGTANPARSSESGTVIRRRQGFNQAVGGERRTIGLIVRESFLVAGRF
jgi:hypothetical protein